MTTTFCTSAAVKLFGGPNLSTSLTNTDYETYINGVEAEICANTREDLIDQYSTLPDANLKKIIERACALGAAVDAINYSTKLFPSIDQAQTAMDFTYARYQDTLKLLKEKPVLQFIQAG